MWCALAFYPDWPYSRSLAICYGLPDGWASGTYEKRLREVTPSLVSLLYGEGAGRIEPDPLAWEV
jgi:hypothetical protein